MDEVHELIDFLKDDRAHMRKGAVEVVLGLTASEDGRATLRNTNVAAQLRRLIGDIPTVAKMAITAMINLSADAEMMEQMLKQGMVGALMESLRDEDCVHKRLIVMLLTNLSQTLEGCDQLLGKTEAGGALLGLYVRRLIQWFVAPVKGGEDTYEHVAHILQNVTQLSEARKIILEPERGILPALLPQLKSASLIRRQGVAATLKNCFFDDDVKHIKYMLSPSVDVITALLLPLAGPDRYTAAEKVGMNPEFYKHGARKARESDPSTRRSLVEAILLLSASKDVRAHLRTVRAYPVIKTFHEWLEGADKVDTASKHEEEAGVMVSHHEGAETVLDADDEATVDAINKIMQQLFREDEVKHTSEVFGERPMPAPAKPAEAKSHRPKQTLLPIEDAKAIAVRVSKGADVDETELGSLLTIAPDWTEDDPILPAAFQNSVAIEDGAVDERRAPATTQAANPEKETTAGAGANAPAVRKIEKVDPVAAAVEAAGFGELD